MRRLFTLLAMLLSVAVIKAQEDGPKQIKLTQEEQQLVQKNNDFAFRLFREARTDKSLLLSPLSITYALGMLNNGAAGKTQQEINDVLGFGEAGADGINQFCRKMLTEAPGLDKETKVSIANTIYVNSGEGYYLQEDFVEKANQWYNAKPESRDFKDGITHDVINQWASDHTEGMIKEVLKEDEFNPYAVSYLLNALYFKGLWVNKFDKENTLDEVFNGSTNVPMMHITARESIDGFQFEYTSSDLYQAVNLPYGNGAYQMTVYLPSQGKSIDDVLAQLNGKSWQMNGKQSYVDLKLPRFETKTSIDLIPMMEALGMTKAFTPSAEFPYFCNENIYIELMKQVAKIKLDEEGTEAAAVTIIGEKATGMQEIPVVDFHATRPFLYIISERSTGTIFFIGQYMGDETAEVKSDEVAVKEVKREEVKSERIYNLSGQRLLTPPAKGLYITDGRLRYRPQ